MKLSELKFSKGVPVVSEPTLMAMRSPLAPHTIYLREVTPDWKSNSGNNEMEFAPLPTAPAYLPRVTEPVEGKRYDCDLATGVQRTCRRASAYWVHDRSGELVTADIAAAYGPLPPREPEPEPLEDCLAKFTGDRGTYIDLSARKYVSTGSMFPAKCRNGELVEIEGAKSFVASEWQIAREWKYAPEPKQ